jgi:MazG family protein
VREELGDLLLNVAFQIVIAEERGQFGAEAVTRGLEEKMWRRHPHLFGLGEKPASWEHGKQGSREPGAGSRSALAGLPPTLPPLLMAYRLQERAAGVGFDWPDTQGPLDKVKEETAELEHELASERPAPGSPRAPASPSGLPAPITDEIGDLLFAVVNLARKLGIEPGQALERANDKFRARFAAVERVASERGLELGRATLAELDAIWDEVKRGEATPG